MFCAWLKIFWGSIRMNFDELFEGIDYCFAEGHARNASDVTVENVITAPEANAQNALYVAMRGVLLDGSVGIRAAYDHGCRLFLCEWMPDLPQDATVLLCEAPERVLGTLASRVYGYPERALTLVGITGSAGKTSVAMMTQTLLSREGFRVAAITTDGVYRGETLSRADGIVHDAASLRRLLATLLREGVTHVLIELSAYQLAHCVADGASFAITALTNLAPRHLRFGEFGDVQDYIEAKERLLAVNAAYTLLPVGFKKHTGGTPVYIGEGGDLFARDVRVSFGGTGVQGMRFLLCSPQGEQEIFLPIPVPFAVQNALFVAAIAQGLGVDTKAIASHLAHIVALGRMECVFSDTERHVYLDSAYEGEDIARSLDLLAPLATGRLSVLVGSVGGRASARRAEIGRAIERHADFAYLTADDPDSEDPVSICEEIRAAMREGDRERTCIIADRTRAIERAVCDLRRGDVLLITGKGNDATQLVRGVRVPFCEREIVRRALREAHVF